MKKLNKFLLPITVLFMGLASCQPDEETPEPETPTTTTPTAPAPPQPVMADANGAMIALDLEFNYDAMGFPVSVNTQMGIAAFYATAGSGTLVDAGTVKINNNTLTKAENNAYLITAGIPTQEPTTLGLDGNISWSVSGNNTNNMPADNFNIDASVYPFPDFEGTIPTEITRANGLSLTFNTTTVKSADSVYVMIVSGSKSLLKAFHRNAGPVVISAADLNTLDASSATAPAYIEIVPWKVMGYTNPMGRVYAYINEKAIVKSITLN